MRLFAYVCVCEFRQKRLALSGGNLPVVSVAGGDAGRRIAIQDLLKVPQVPAGEYVVGFRWDCETSSQVWSTCADITIV